MGGQSAEAAAAAAASAEGQDASLVRAPVKHVLSQELQLYFDRVAHLLKARPGACHIKHWHQQPLCCKFLPIQIHNPLGAVLILGKYDLSDLLLYTYVRTALSWNLLDSAGGGSSCSALLTGSSPL